MTAHTRIEVTIQTDKVVMVWRKAGASRWCPKCGRHVDVVDRVQAEILAGMTTGFSGGAGEKRWHLIDAGDGTPLVCLHSLLKPD
jgi:hypothetical protein